MKKCQDNLNSQVDAFRNPQDFHLWTTLPDFPLMEEFNWSSELNDGLPPLHYKVSDVILVKRLLKNFKQSSICSHSLLVLPEVPDVNVIPSIVSGDELPELPNETSEQRGREQCKVSEQEVDGANEVLNEGNKSFDIISNAPSVDAMVSLDELEKIGLPELPGVSTILGDTDNDGASDPSTKDQETKPRAISSKVRKKSGSTQYANDHVALNKVLAATAALMDRMPSESAVDCLVEMPSWMRNIFIARHGVPRLIGIMLAKRLEAAGEAGIIGLDGEIMVHNTQGPVEISQEKLDFSSVLPKSQSPLDRLTHQIRMKKRFGVKISNTNHSVNQIPLTQNKILTV
jgi:hypothetical protein